MHPSCRGFACCVQARHAGASPKIGFYSAHRKVRGRAHGSHVAGEIETVARTRGEDTRETLFQKFLGLGGHVQVDVVAVRFDHLRGNRPRNNVARSQFLCFVIALHEAFQVNVAQNPAFPAQRFTQQKSWRTFDRERRGVKLHELHIRQNRARLVGNRHAVAGCHFRIGGLAK